jgi:lipocalin
MVGNARPLNESSTEAKFLVSFPTVGAYDAPYWVLDSDYTNHTLILSCRPYGNGNSIQTMWFLSRQRSPSGEVRDYVHNKIAELGLSTYLVLKPTVQDNCMSNSTSY